MAKKKESGEISDKEHEKLWAEMNYRQRAEYVRKHLEYVTRNDGEVAKEIKFTKKDLETLKRDYESLKAWADYEQFYVSILDRDLVADARAVKLFDNMKDPRDRSDEPEMPENMREKIGDQVDLLWPFD